MCVILALLLRLKETLPGINLCVEYKLRKNKVIINGQIENTFSVKFVSISWHEAIQMKNFTVKKNNFIYLINLFLAVQRSHCCVDF